MYRKSSVIITILAMTISVMVMLGVEHIRHQAKVSFSSSVSGVDLIVGARTGQLNLLLYSVFRMGSPTANISWQSYENLKQNKDVKWAVPISLGDSHKGYRVLGTTPDYFTFFKYAEEQSLELQNGAFFQDTFDVVLGHKVAQQLNYQIGDKIIISHGIGSTSFTKHDKNPFVITGILQATGTPVDQTVHVSLQRLEAVHTPAAFQRGLDLTPQSVTAIMLGLKSRIKTFSVQRAINTDKQEPMTAILPGVALAEFWQSMAVLENTLQIVSGLVFVSAVLGLTAMLIASIRERKEEIRLMRMVGASPFFIVLIIQIEALLIVITSIITALALLVACLAISKNYLLTQYAIGINPISLVTNSSFYLISIMGISSIAALIPALMAYKGSKR
ncbi:ABC transporter permease [Catenovulum agarivorans]|uniref:ABC transporter permease n=1 Tax=Catenovulum agarivorans TaxID=1172192 RepID=UPI001ED90CD0|nr:ABC transporter permease [Catenovulum agarivorans]